MIKVKKIWNNICNMSPAAKASFWFVVSSVVLKGISFITTPIFTRILDVADYGTTSVFVTWEGVISVFATLTLSGGVYNVAMTKFEDDVDTFTSTMLGLTAVSSMFVYSVCIGINLVFPQLFQLDTSYLIYMWLQTFMNAIISFWLSRKRYLYKYKEVIAYTFLNALLSPVGAVIAIFLFPENKAYAKVIGAGIIGILIGVCIMISALKKGKKIYYKPYWVYALKFSIPLVPHYLSSILLHSSDKLMLNNMIGAASAGIYSVSNSITGIVTLVTQAINYSLVPYTLRSIKKREIRNLKQVTVGCSLLVSAICMCVMLFAKEGILIFATEQYLDAVWFVFPLTLSVQISFVVGIVGNILFYYEKPQYMSAITIGSAVLNIIMNYFSIRWFGSFAVGYTTLISSALSLFLHYMCVKKFEQQLDEIVNIKLLLLIYAVFVVVMAYGMIFYNSLFLRLLLIGIIFVLLIIFRKKIITLLRTMKRSKTEAEK